MLLIYFKPKYTNAIIYNELRHLKKLNIFIIDQEGKIYIVSVVVRLICNML